MSARPASYLSALLALLLLGGLGVATLVEILDGSDGPRAERVAPTPPWPDSLADAMDLPGSLRFYLARRYAGYDSFKTLHSGVMLDVFGRSGTPTVMIGRSGWLFLDNEAAFMSSLARGGDMTARISDWVEGLNRVERDLSSRGIEFHLIIAPNKHSVAHAFLPGWAPAPEGRPIRDAVLQARGGRDPDLSAVFAATGGPPEDFYHSTDTHWSEAGASVALDAAIGPLMPSPTWRPAVRPGGDLARSLGLAERLPEVFEESDLDDRIDCRTDDGRSYRPEPIDPLPLRSFSCTSKLGSGRAVVHMDSFGMNAVRPIAARHAETLFIWDKRVDPAAAQDWGADRVFLIIAERALIADAPEDVVGKAR